MWVPRDFLWDLVPQDLVSLHLRDMAFKFELCFVLVLPDCVNSEADVQRLLQLVIEGGPLFRWHHVQLPIVALELNIPLLALLLYPDVFFAAAFAIVVPSCTTGDIIF